MNSVIKPRSLGNSFRKNIRKVVEESLKVLWWCGYYHCTSNFNR